MRKWDSVQQLIVGHQNLRAMHTLAQQAKSLTKAQFAASGMQQSRNLGGKCVGVLSLVPHDIRGGKFWHPDLRAAVHMPPARRCIITVNASTVG